MSRELWSTGPKHTHTGPPSRTKRYSTNFTISEFTISSTLSAFPNSFATLALEPRNRAHRDNREIFIIFRLEM